MQVKLLTPGSLGQGAPSSPSASPPATPPGMWCQITPPDTTTGQISIVLWPLYTLYNAMPSLLHWRLLDNTPTEPLSGHSVHREGTSGILQPGVQQPLGVALQGGQALCFQLPWGSIATMHGPEASPAPSTGSTGNSPTRAWSAPLEARRHAGGAEASRMFPEAHRRRSMLPEAGQKLALSVPCNTAEDTSLSVVLAAKLGSNKAPSTTLCLVPHAVLHNSLPFAVTLACSELPDQATAAASSSQALDWGPMQLKPKKAVLAVLAQHGQSLQSEGFPLDSQHDTQLTFNASCDTDPAQPQLQGSGGQKHQLKFFAAVSVYTSQLEMQAGAAGGSAGSAVEVTHISITPACFVTNLTGRHLKLQLQGSPVSQGVETKALAQSDTEHSAAKPLSTRTQHMDVSSNQTQAYDTPQREGAEPWVMSCTASQTVPVLNGWQFVGQSSSKHLDPKQATALPSVAAEVSLLHAPSADPRTPDADTQAQPSASPSLVTPSGRDNCSVNCTHVHMFTVQQPHTGTPASSGQQHGILLTQPCGRRHLHVFDDSQQGEGSIATLAYRTLLSRGRLHVIFFVDPQPPVTIQNDTHQRLSVAWVPLHRNQAQHAQYAEQCFEVPSGVSLECSPQSSLLGAQTGEMVLISPSQLLYTLRIMPVLVKGPAMCRHNQLLGYARKHLAPDYLLVSSAERTSSLHFHACHSTSDSAHMT